VAARDAEQPRAPRRIVAGLAPASEARRDALDGGPASAGPARSGGRAADDRPAGEPSPRAVPDFAHAVPKSVHGGSVPAPSFFEGELEEVAVCELCGLVVRERVPPACPACGGGFG
jgi:hypothetical protein